jgi:hypothetical protein
MSIASDLFEKGYDRIREAFIQSNPAKFNEFVADITSKSEIKAQFKRRSEMLNDKQLLVSALKEADAVYGGCDIPTTLYRWIGNQGGGPARLEAGAKELLPAFLLKTISGDLVKLAESELQLLSEEFDTFTKKNSKILKELKEHGEL